jgi:hypothetical protein
MPRRGRAASPAPRAHHAAPRAASPPPPSRYTPAPAPQSAPMMSPAGAQQPSMMKQMAVTAGGVAVGSAIGHVAGSAMTGMFSGGGSSQEAAAAPAAAPPPQQYGQQPYGQQQPSMQQDQGPCAWEVKNFVQCAQQQPDITLCEGFNEALRQCKQQSGMN